MKKKLLNLSRAFMCITVLISQLGYVANASDKKSENINMVIVFNDNKIDTNVKELITNSGGKIIKEISELGGIEVECKPKIISKIKSQDSVESISPSHIIKIENNRIDSNEYYKNSEETSYYEDKGTTYYENNSNGYYEDKGTSYYENKGTTYYEDNNLSNEESIDIFNGNLYEKYQWDIKKVTNNGESFNVQSGNHNTIVGIVDSGVDTDHSDLKYNFLGGKNLVPENFQNDDTEKGDISDIEDRFGHGTEVAGQIAANGRIKGVAPNIGFKSYRIFDKYGQTTAAICADAIIAAVEDNVEVINLSFGAFYLDGECKWTNKDTGEVYDLGDDMADYSLLERAIEYAINNNILVITAAGNEGLDCSDNKKLAEHFNNLYESQGFSYSGLMYEEPGSFDGVINVSATDKNDSIASYSNYGQGFIDITAPGGDFNGKVDLDNLCITTSIGNGYSFNFGTSFSAPKVSAAVALLICQNKNIKSSEVKDIIYEKAKYMDSDQYYGAGMLNIYDVLS